MLLVTCKQTFIHEWFLSYILKTVLCLDNLKKVTLVCMVKGHQQGRFVPTKNYLTKQVNLIRENHAYLIINLLMTLLEVKFIEAIFDVEVTKQDWWWENALLIMTAPMFVRNQEKILFTKPMVEIVSNKWVVNITFKYFRTDTQKRLLIVSPFYFWVYVVTIYALFNTCLPTCLMLKVGWKCHSLLIKGSCVRIAVKRSNFLDPFSPNKSGSKATLPCQTNWKCFWRKYNIKKNNY